MTEHTEGPAPQPPTLRDPGLPSRGDLAQIDAAVDTIRAHLTLVDSVSRRQARAVIPAPPLGRTLVLDAADAARIAAAPDTSPALRAWLRAGATYGFVVADRAELDQLTAQVLADDLPDDLPTERGDALQAAWAQWLDDEPLAVELASPERQRDIYHDALVAGFDAGEAWAQHDAGAAALREAADALYTDAGPGNPLSAATWLRERADRLADRPLAHPVADALAAYTAAQAEARCPECGGLGGAHGVVHHRHPAGGGGVNRPCSRPLDPRPSDELDRPAPVEDVTHGDGKITVGGVPAELRHDVDLLARLLAGDASTDPGGAGQASAELARRVVVDWGYRAPRPAGGVR